MSDGPIEQAAILSKEGEIYTLSRPARHHDILREANVRGTMKYNSGKLVPPYQQGFVIVGNRGRHVFVDREFALRIAIDAGQVEEGKTHHGRYLFSEDLW